MTLIPLKPIAAFRSGDLVLIFNDNPRGWEFFSSVTALSREALAAFVDSTTDEAIADSRPTDGLVVIPLSNTSLPLAFPEHRMVAFHPRLFDPNVPMWEGPTTRAAEEAAEEELGADVESFLSSLS